VHDVGPPVSSVGEYVCVVYADEVCALTQSTLICPSTTVFDT
jgi:hypothetical protein